MIGELTTVLFRKSDVGDAFERFLGKQYMTLSDMATWLSMLSHKNCDYLPEALTYFRMHDGQDQRSNGIKIKANVEWLELFCDADQQQKVLTDKPAADELHGSKLVIRMWFLSLVRDEVKVGDYPLKRIQAVIDQATAILFGKIANGGGWLKKVITGCAIFSWLLLFNCACRFVFENHSCLDFHFVEPQI